MLGAHLLDPVMDYSELDRGLEPLACWMLEAFILHINHV